MAAGHLKPLGDEVDAEHLRRSVVLRDPGGHLADRAQAEHRDRPASGISAYSTACQAVGSTSDRYTKRSSGGPSGTLMGPNCAWGTRRYSACPPGTWP